MLFGVVPLTWFVVEAWIIHAYLTVYYKLRTSLTHTAMDPKTFRNISISRAVFLTLFVSTLVAMLIVN